MVRPRGQEKEVHGHLFIPVSHAAAKWNTRVHLGKTRDASRCQGRKEIHEGEVLGDGPQVRGFGPECPPSIHGGVDKDPTGYTFGRAKHGVQRKETPNTVPRHSTTNKVEDEG
eukprot:maker-scaffold427_size174323-snap-gene-0.34 protein:Tk04503 transcript:maker-scaffold427_size174323-snap-gene-0.34-mRNA-1 annotation:"hypothetical protein"